jgi:upstream stimulatory factor
MMQTPTELTFPGHSQLFGSKINSNKTTNSPIIINNSDNHMSLNAFSSSSSTVNSAKTYTPASALLNLPTPSSALQSTTVTTVTLSSSPIPSSISQTATSSSPSQTVHTKLIRDERRRANHNEVERRRRDNINKWIVELSKVIPECSNDQSKHGQSKGGILEKTVLYLCELRQANQQLAEHIRSLDQLHKENEFLKQEVTLHFT